MEEEVAVAEEVAVVEEIAAEEEVVETESAVEVIVETSNLVEEVVAGLPGDVEAFEESDDSIIATKDLAFSQMEMVCDEQDNLAVAETTTSVEVSGDDDFVNSDGEPELAAFMFGRLPEISTVTAEEPGISQSPADSMIQAHVSQRYTCKLRCRKPGGLFRGPILSFYCKFICRSGNY